MIPVKSACFQFKNVSSETWGERAQFSEGHNDYNEAAKKRSWYEWLPLVFTSLRVVNKSGTD